MLRLRKAVYVLVNASKKWWDRLLRSLLNHGFTSCALDPCAFVLIKQKRVRVHLDHYANVVDMEHCGHGLSQIGVPKEDKLELERMLSTTAMTRYRGGLGSVRWLVDHCCPQLSSDPSQRRRRQNDATIQELPKIEQDDTISEVV